MDTVDVDVHELVIDPTSTLAAPLARPQVREPGTAARQVREPGTAAPHVREPGPAEHQIREPEPVGGGPVGGGPVGGGPVGGGPVGGGPVGGRPTDSARADAPALPHIPRQSTGEPDLGVDDGLTERQRQILAFERQWWRHAGAKEQAIRDLFEVSSTRYYQMLNALLDNPAALAYDPVLVQRLRRLRATRARARGGRS